jgi:hypothetical protein
MGQFMLGEVGFDSRRALRVGQVIIPVRLLRRADGGQPLENRSASCR